MDPEKKPGISGRLLAEAGRLATEGGIFNENPDNAIVETVHESDGLTTLTNGRFDPSDMGDHCGDLDDCDEVEL
ncbi:hypothetical protein HY625_02915 [Candidatus Uhrbacteria bacterium]|nr:hypothetical protein [Candidatus Uhrbacteria bacterium]